MKIMPHDHKYIYLETIRGTHIDLNEKEAHKVLLALMTYFQKKYGSWEAYVENKNETKNTPILHRS